MTKDERMSSVQEYLKEACEVLDREAGSVEPAKTTQLQTIIVALMLVLLDERILGD
jgi:hypothetical protein